MFAWVGWEFVFNNFLPLMIILLFGGGWLISIGGLYQSLVEPDPGFWGVGSIVFMVFLVVLFGVLVLGTLYLWYQYWKTGCESYPWTEGCEEGSTPDNWWFKREAERKGRNWEDVKAEWLSQHQPGMVDLDKRVDALVDQIVGTTNPRGLENDPNYQGAFDAINKYYRGEKNDNQIKNYIQYFFKDGDNWEKRMCEFFTKENETDLSTYGFHCPTESE